MEESKTKNIESSLAAFRAIKTFVFMKGAYPRNFDTVDRLMSGTDFSLSFMIFAEARIICMLCYLMGSEQYSRRPQSTPSVWPYQPMTELPCSGSRLLCT